MPLVMGVLNVTPDSFSDGGLYLRPADAIAHGRRLIAEGADIIDVGGESTRPRAEPVAVAEQLRRVIPVVEALSSESRVSIDTRSAEVAEAAIAAGATLLNDVSASLHEVAAAHHEVGWVAMHMLGAPRTMQDQPHYDDVVGEVAQFLVARAEAGRAAGVEEIWVDPGIGFGKTREHNLALLANLDRLVGLGWPVLVGTSRKRFLGDLLARSDAAPAPGAAPAPAPAATDADPVPVDPVPVDDRLEGSLATATWAMGQGVTMIRAHDVAPTVEAALIVAGEAPAWR